MQPWGGGVFSKHAFTLIELLAVIVLLAVIAIISVLVIGDIVENTKKKALESSLWAIDSATKNYYFGLVLKNDTDFTDPKTFKIQNNNCQVVENDSVVKGRDCLEFDANNIHIGYVSLYILYSIRCC